MIPCIAWVKRGKAKQRPEKLQIAQDDLKRIIEETQERLEDEDEGKEEVEGEENVEPDNNTKVSSKSAEHLATSVKNECDVDEVALAHDISSRVKGTKQYRKKKGEAAGGDDIDSKYNMNDYDTEENDLSNPLRGIGYLTMFSSNEDDPYVKIKDDDDSDVEDYELNPTDNLILVARAEEEFCSVEVHVYNEELGNLYVHHDILLPTFPLALEWIDYDLRDGKQGNFLAIGTMEPTIDIWDLDLVDSLEPLATLGAKSRKKRKKKGCGGHGAAVLDLSWNPLARHVLASASADHTVALWDLTEGRVAMSLQQHTDKVQCVKWHPVEEHMLLSGSFDKCVKMYDCRTPDTNNKSWNLDGEIEKIIWNHFSPLNFFASTDLGHVFYMDSRSDQPIYTLAAHQESVTGLCMSCQDAKILVTTSTDHTVKVWDIAGNQPSLVHSKNLRLGRLHCLGSCPDSPYVFAIGGDKDVKVWDIRDSTDVLQHFFPNKAAKDQQEGDKADVDDTCVAMETQEMVSVDTAATNEAPAENKLKRKKKKKKQLKQKR